MYADDVKKKTMIGIKPKLSKGSIGEFKNCVTKIRGGANTSSIRMISPDNNFLLCLNDLNNKMTNPIHKSKIKLLKTFSGKSK